MQIYRKEKKYQSRMLFLHRGTIESRDIVVLEQSKDHKQETYTTERKEVLQIIYIHYNCLNVQKVHLGCSECNEVNVGKTGNFYKQPTRGTTKTGYGKVQPYTWVEV